MTVTDRVLARLRAGLTITAMTARWTYGVPDLQRVLWNIRARGYRIASRKRVTQTKFTSQTVTVVEYYLDGTRTKSDRQEVRA